MPKSEFKFNGEEKKLLLKLARESIAAKLQNIMLPSLELGFPAAQRPGAAFVTLHCHGQLRGCIGHIRAVRPLAETIQEMALAAAFEDPRFYPLQENELPELEIEISVLSPMDKLKSPNDLVVGKHGLFIVQGLSSGLLLPQVATEQGWNKEQFLAGVCQKAGLPSDAWRKNAELYVFQAEIFQEK